MNTNPCRIVASLMAVAFTTIVGAQSINPEASATRLPIQVRAPRGMEGLVKPQKLRAAALAAVNAEHGDGPLSISTQSFNGYFVGATLPFWTFNIKGSRDGDHHLGVMVGHDPFRQPGTDRIPTYIVPLIFRTHTVANKIDGDSRSHLRAIHDDTRYHDHRSDQS
jgi:hypothetical protein